MLVLPHTHGAVVTVEPQCGFKFEDAQASRGQEHVFHAIKAGVHALFCRLVAAPTLHFGDGSLIANALGVGRGSKRNQENKKPHAPDVGGVCGFVESLGEYLLGAR